MIYKNINAEYRCGDEISDDCQTEYNNAQTNGNLEYFYERCATEGGSQPLRTRCQLCCNNQNNRYAVIRKCAEINDVIHDDIHDCDENELYIKNECICGTQLCNRECHCHSNGDGKKCYKCNANDPWCGNLEDLEDHGYNAQTKCASNKCKMIGMMNNQINMF